jgi:putative ABC transport system permease protein
VLLSYIALALGIGIFIVLFPLYKNLIGKQLNIPYLDSFVVIPLVLALGLIVGVISGSYPAFFLSSFKPIAALKGNKSMSKGGSWLRNILVIFQFTISIFLIIGTLAVNQQLKFFQNKQLGFDKEQVLIINNPGSLRNTVNPFKEELRKYSSIIDVSGSGNGAREIFLEGIHDRFACGSPQRKICGITGLGRSHREKDQQLVTEQR